MRKLILVSTAALVALAVTGVAVATLKPSGTQQVSATFSAPKRERGETRVCTGADGTYEITNAVYSGEADSTTPALDGPLVLQVKAVYNQTTKAGWVEGHAWIRGSDAAGDRRAHARFDATLGDGGAVEGFLGGRIGWRYADLHGNVSATFTPAGGFVNGKIGGGGGSNLAVLAGRPCSGKPAPIAVKLEVKGTVEKFDTASITVKPRDNSASQTCALKSGVSPSLGDLKVGETVEMRCGPVDGAMTLLKLERKRGEKD